MVPLGNNLRRRFRRVSEGETEKFQFKIQPNPTTIYLYNLPVLCAVKPLNCLAIGLCWFPVFPPDNPEVKHANLIIY